MDVRKITHEFQNVVYLKVYILIQFSIYFLKYHDNTFCLCYRLFWSFMFSIRFLVNLFHLWSCIASFHWRYNKRFHRMMENKIILGFGKIWSFLVDISSLEPDPCCQWYLQDEYEHIPPFYWLCVAIGKKWAMLKYFYFFLNFYLENKSTGSITLFLFSDIC